MFHPSLRHNNFAPLLVCVISISSDSRYVGVHLIVGWSRLETYTRIILVMDGMPVVASEVGGGVNDCLSMIALPTKRQCSESVSATSGRKQQ